MNKRKAVANIKFLMLIGIFFVCISLLISNVIQSLIEKEAKVQLKLDYSMYSKAIAETAAMMDDETGCYFSTESGVANDYSRCNEFYIQLVKNLNVSKYCKKDGLENGCVPVYEVYATDKNCAGYSESMMNKFNPSFVLNNKSSLIVYNYPNGYMKPVFAVDVNGLMKPNKPGHDLFSFVIVKNKNGSYYLHPNITYCLPETNGGIRNIHDVL